MIHDARYRIINTKSEYLNSKQIKNSNDKNLKLYHEKLEEKAGFRLHDTGCMKTVIGFQSTVHSHFSIN
jgi:hypothetical protein